MAGIRTPALRKAALFLGLFVLAVSLALTATFLAISGIGPIVAEGPVMIALLTLNALIIIALGYSVLRHYRLLQRGTGEAGGNRLAKRFVGFFGLAAMLPAMLVAAFLGLTVARGLDYWFGDKVRTTVEESAQIASENLESVISSLEGQVKDLASDLNQEGASAALFSDPGQYRSYLRQQAILRGFDAVDVVSHDGVVLATTRTSGAVPSSMPEDYQEAETGAVALRLYEASGTARALYKLDGYDDAYVRVVVESFEPATLARLRRAEAAVLDYRDALRRSGRVGMVFAIGFAQITALIFLLSVRLALDAAGRVSEPIERLAYAATQVREGELDTRVPVPSTDDELAVLTRAFNEMTERLQVQRSDIEAARQEAEDRRAFLEALLSDVTAGVIRTDETLRITIANSAALELLDLPEGEIAGRELGEVIPEFLDSAKFSLREQASHDVTIELPRAGMVRHFSLKTSPDRTGGCVLTFDDTTRLIIAQRHLAWRDVARRIAHEIRNPLTPIQLSAERLRRKYRDLAGPDDQTFDKCTETILRQVADIGRMVEEFSNFARMPKPTVERFNLIELMERVTYSQRMVTPDAGVALRAPSGPVWIQGDERLLGQALANVLKNAAEAITRRPESDDFIGQIGVGVSHGEGRVVIAVEDNGPGFPAQDRDRLLEPYVTHREGGTGLGLAIVARIVSDHGGHLALRNREDGRRGARVEITLPEDADQSLQADGEQETGRMPASTEERIAWQETS